MPDEEKSRYDRDLDINDFDAAEMASRASRFDRMVENDFSGLDKALRNGFYVIMTAAPEGRHIRARVQRGPSGDVTTRLDGFFAGVDVALLAHSECLAEGLPADPDRGPEVPKNCDPLDQWILDGGHLTIEGGHNGFYVELRESKGSTLERVGAKKLTYNHTLIRRSSSRDLHQALASAWKATAREESTLAF